MEERIMGKASKQVSRFQRENPQMSPVQMQYEREQTRKRLEVNLKCYEREAAFKQGEITSGNIIETRAVNQVPGQPAIILDGFKDGLKPAFAIQNELDQIKLHIDSIKEQLENITKAEENAKTTNSRI